MSEPAKIRVLVVDDHRVVRVGIRALIEDEPDMEVVGDVGDAASALAAFAAHDPDVVLVDLRLPGISGVELIARLRRMDTRAKVLVVTTYDQDPDVQRALGLGARGVLLKGSFPRGVLENAIRTVHAGGQALSPEVAQQLAGARPLSPREAAVLAMVSRGLSNREIGAALALSEATVKFHLKNTYDKLGVRDRTKAAMFAAQRGLLRPPR